MDLTSIVVVPARDEERRIAGCLRALAAQTIGTDAFEVVLVLDGCRDATGTIAGRAAAELDLRLTTVTGPGQGPGAARRLGMERAAERLLGLGLPEGLIATTDADSAAAPDWLERQLAHLRDGAEAIAGLIELDPAERRALPAAVVARRARDAERRLDRVRRRDATAGHHHFAGASLGITAAAYRRAGGIEPLAVLEDAAFATRLAGAGVPVLRPTDVRVRTSARADGRVARGLSVDLEVSLWRERNRFRAASFDPAALAAGRAAVGADVTVIIPAKQCAATIGAILAETVAPLRRAGLVDHVFVVDAASRDGTAEVARAAGALVLQQDALAPELGPAQGKGDAMWRALAATPGEIVCFLDGDTADPSPLHLLGLIGPLLTRPELSLVKGTFERPLSRAGVVADHEGGRVTELMARPVLNLHHPRLAGFAQPLAGEFSGRRELLEAIPFPVGYGVEIAVLIDALRREGLSALAESDLGRRQNRHQPLRALGEMAFAVLAAAERRRGPGHEVISDSYLRPWEDGATHAVAIEERPPLVDRRGTEVFDDAPGCTAGDHPLAHHRGEAG